MVVTPPPTHEMVPPLIDTFGVPRIYGVVVENQNGVQPLGTVNDCEPDPPAVVVTLPTTRPIRSGVSKISTPEPFHTCSPCPITRCPS
jgi:hypothetical protein